MIIDIISRNYDTTIHPTDFCEMLIGERKIVKCDMFFGVTNIMTKFQNDYLEFEGLLQKMASKKPFMIQEICYINGNGERKLCTLSAYI